MESLLRSIFSRAGARGRDFTIYALCNAGADDAASTLNRIFDEDRSITSGNVVIVPEQRLNALTVFAGRSDRERIESLIEAHDNVLRANQLRQPSVMLAREVTWPGSITRGSRKRW